MLTLAGGWIVAVSPSQSAGDWFPHADKLRHGLAFLCFAFLVEGARLRPRWLWLAAVLAYGVAIEWAQSRVPGRDASLADAIADGVGLLIGALLAPWWTHWLAHHLSAETKTPPADFDQK